MVKEMSAVNVLIEDKGWSMSARNWRGVCPERDVEWTWCMSRERCGMNLRRICVKIDQERDEVCVCVCVKPQWFSLLVCSVETSLGLSGICFVYASVCLAGAISIFFLVPETKGRTLAEIEAYFAYVRTWGLAFPAGAPDQSISGILDLDASTVDTYSTFH